jgi:hypothetical protein
LDLSAPALVGSTPFWAAVSGAISGFFGWFVSIRNASASLERAKIAMKLEATATEAAERSEFRATLMAEIAAMRNMMKECEADRDTLRIRVNTAEAQILVLRASNEIMERWVAFFKEGAAPQARDTKAALHSEPILPSNDRLTAIQLPAAGQSGP